MCLEASRYRAGQVLRGVWLDSDLNNTPQAQPNREVHSVVLRCGQGCGTLGLAEQAAVTVPTCRQHWRPVMTVDHTFWLR